MQCAGLRETVCGCARTEEVRAVGAGGVVFSYVRVEISQPLAVVPTGDLWMAVGRQCCKCCSPKSAREILGASKETALVPSSPPFTGVRAHNAQHTRHERPSCMSSRWSRQRTAGDSGQAHMRDLVYTRRSLSSSWSELVMTRVSSYSDRLAVVSIWNCRSHHEEVVCCLTAVDAICRHVITDSLREGQSASGRGPGSRVPGIGRAGKWHAYSYVRR